MIRLFCFLPFFFHIFFFLYDMIILEEGGHMKKMSILGIISLILLSGCSPFQTITSYNEAVKVIDKAIEKTLNSDGFEIHATFEGEQHSLNQVSLNPKDNERIDNDFSDDSYELYYNNENESQEYYSLEKTTYDNGTSDESFLYNSQNDSFHVDFFANSISFRTSDDASFGLPDYKFYTAKYFESINGETPYSTYTDRQGEDSLIVSEEVKDNVQIITISMADPVKFRRFFGSYWLADRCQTEFKDCTIQVVINSKGMIERIEKNLDYEINTKFDENYDSLNGQLPLSESYRKKEIYEINNLDKPAQMNQDLINKYRTIEVSEEYYH